MGCVTQMDLLQVLYRPEAPQGNQKDCEFSRATMAQQRDRGLMDAEFTLAAAPWLAPKTKEIGVRVFDVWHELVTAKRLAAGESEKEVA